MKPSTFLTAGEASRATGKSIPTITRNVKNGKIANSRQGDDGEYEIDPTALFNRYPAIDPALGGKSNDTPNKLGRETPQNNDALDLIKTMTRDLKASHEALLDEKDATISNLTIQLAETKALTDQRSPEVKAKEENAVMEAERLKAELAKPPKTTRRKLTMRERIFGGKVEEAA